MGSISVACYKPKSECEDALLHLVRNHLPPLRAEGLVTDRASIVMRTADGSIVCSYERPCSLPEFNNMFGHFEPI